MGWRIHVVVNTVDISRDCAEDILENANDEGAWSDIDDVCVDGKLHFNQDDMEHMDYLGNNDNVIPILKKHKVKGDVCFSSLEGDNAGENWGYRFDGKGGMRELVGGSIWKVKKGR